MFKRYILEVYKVLGEELYMIAAVKKRDGRLEKFKPEKITWAIFKAARAVGGNDFEMVQGLCDEVVDLSLIHI